MSYTFDIIGVTPVLNFFTYQQQLEHSPQRSKAYLGSYHCTLDALIESTAMVPQKPDWDWDKVVDTIVNFWLNHEDTVQLWKHELQESQSNSVIVARVANMSTLRSELESLLKD